MAMTVFGKLIDEQRRRLGGDKPWSVSRLEAESWRVTQRGEEGIARSTWANWLSETKPFPPTGIAADRLRIAARTLRLPLTVLVDASLESQGLRRSATPSGHWQLITQAVEELPERQRAALERQVDALLDLYRHDEEV